MEVQEEARAMRKCVACWLLTPRKGNCVHCGSPVLEEGDHHEIGGEGG